MNKNRHAGLGLYTIGIAALFLAGFFLLVVFGAQSYRSTVGGQNRNMQSRALLSYLSTTVKGYDAEGAVGIDEDAEVGKVLILREGRSGGEDAEVPKNGGKIADLKLQHIPENTARICIPRS